MSSTVADESPAVAASLEGHAGDGRGSRMDNGGVGHPNRREPGQAVSPMRGTANGTSAPPAGNSQPKRRRIIEDDDDDDYSVPAPPSRSHPSTDKAHRTNGNSHQPQTGDRQKSDGKKKIVAGPPKSGTSGLKNGLGSGSASGSSRKSGGGSIPSGKEDVPFGTLMKNNGLKKEGSFKIPKREGGSSPRPAQSSSQSSKSRSGSSPASAQNRTGTKATRDDADFERKPKKRPVDVKKADDRDFVKEDPPKAAQRKRKLDKEQAAREEPRKKRRDSQGSGGTSAPRAKVKTEPRREGAGTAKARAAPSRAKTERRFKEQTRKERIEQAMKVYKWWEHPQHTNGRQWESLEHNGAHFAADYQPHGVKLKYDGQDVDLTPQQEEIATFYASMPLDGPQLAEQGKVFNKNFMEDFKAALGRGHKIKDFKLLDFSAMRRHLETVKQIKKAATDGEKAATKTAKEELAHKYNYAIVDGHLEKVGNFVVEPPGLFRGRGKHPKTGKVKARVWPSDIALNCGEDVCVPRCAVPGYAWQHVQHDPTVTWLGKWDGVLTGTKYMMLAASSSFKGKSDMAKYDKAMALKGNIDFIRADYTKKLTHHDLQTKQIATAVWIIDQLALRVGGEKGEDEADTVGCCSLRREHLTFNPDPKVHEIDLEFLGKDSMLFKQTIDFDKYGDVGTRVFRNLQAFCKDKRQPQEVFDRLDPSILNAHLQGLMRGLTAKVFRTYNASETLQRQLPTAEALAGLSVAEKVALYNGANREVAILCNHQRTVSSAQKEGLEKLHTKLKLLKSQKKELQSMMRCLTGKEKGRMRLKSPDKSAEDSAQRALDKAKKAKANAKTDEEKVAAAASDKKASELKKKAAQLKQEEMHLFAKTPNVQSVTSRVKQWTQKIAKLQVDIRNKEDNKEVSLTTSKINYMDPRVSVAWCKRHEVPVEKVFATTLRDKFVWAMNVPPEWEFSHLTLPEFQGKAGAKAKKSPPSKAAATTSSAAAAKKLAAASAPAKTEALKGKGKAKISDEEDDDDGDEDDSSEEEDDSESGDEDSEDEDSEDDEDDDEGEEDDDGDEDDEDDDGDEDDHEEGDEEDEDEEVMPSKKRRGGADSNGAVGSPSKKTRRPRIEDDDDDSDFAP